MFKKIFAFGILVLLGLSAARPTIEDPYLEEKFSKAECLRDYFGDLFEIIEGEFDGPSMEGLWIEMTNSFSRLIDYAVDGDYASFNAEYVYFISLANQATANYFYYGVLYYTQGEGDPEGMYEMYDYYYGEVIPNMMACFSGEMEG